jgi:hypothetical protein
MAEFKKPAKHHIHIDARKPIPEPMAEELVTLGFTRSIVALNCLTAARGISPNAEITERMYEDAQPDTWTYKGDDTATFEQVYKRGVELCEFHKLDAYIEAEYINVDIPFVGKEFDEAVYDRWAPRVEGVAAEAGQDNPAFFTDSEGVIRRRPFVATMRELDPSRGEACPTMEYHLTLTQDKCDPRLFSILMASGLQSYDVTKPLRLKDGTPVMNGDEPVVYHDRPLTARYSAGDKDNLFKGHHFLTYTEMLVKMVSEIGGVEAPQQLEDGLLREFCSMKVEHIVNFQSFNLSNQELPAVVERVSYRSDLQPEAQKVGIRTVGNRISQMFTAGNRQMRS